VPEPTCHVLVVADRTALSAALRTALLARAARGPAEFTLLLPAPAGYEAPQRLLVAVEQLRASGLDMAGQLGDADPLTAVEQAWDPHEYDEVVLGTLPPGRSRWLADELPERIERLTGVAVTVVFDRPR
jgi:hypothetical protein